MTTQPEPAVGLYANAYVGSDCHPYEIVRVVSQRCIEVREVDAVLADDWAPDIVAGGFAGHCANNQSQRWVYSTNTDHQVIKLRRRKDGLWYSAHGWPHRIAAEPRRFHDYNF